MKDFIKNTDVIRSKIHRNWYLWTFCLFFLIIFALIMYILKTVIFMLEDGFSLSYFLFMLFFIVLDLFLLLVLKDFKYLVININRNQIKYYSILRPFGRTLKLENYSHKLKTSEFSIRGEYQVIHLVNEEGYTVFKINGLFYENFKALDSSIKLPRIYDYKFNWKLYLRLLFTGKIKVEKHSV